MAYINVFVSNQAKIYVKNSQLCLEKAEKRAEFPLEDVNCVMIENLQTTISTHTLSALSQEGILCFICNQNHLPSGVILPFCEHYQTLSQYNYQASLSKPLQKQLWKKIIENKIKNQDAVLGMMNKKDKLKILYESVASGDALNNEAKASLIYFKELFGTDFSRREENDINSFLNYGYAIIRGFVARSIVAHGLMPFLGIFHCNQFNQFNLADDLMEIFRPMVDAYTVKNFSGQKLSSKEKAGILNLINYNVVVDGQKQALSHAIEMFVQSYQKSIKEGKVCLKEVSIVNLEMHSYE